MPYFGRCQKWAVALGRFVQAVVVLLVVVVLVATSVAAGAVVESVGVLVMLLGRLVLLVVVVAAGSVAYLCHVHLHRLLRVESLVLAEMVSRVRKVFCLGICRCCLVHGLAVVRSHVGRTLVGSLCRLYVAVVVVRCGVVADAVVQSRAVAHCAGLSQVVILLMLLVVGYVLLLVFYGRVGVLTQFGKSSL